MPTRTRQEKPLLQITPDYSRSAFVFTFYREYVGVGTSYIVGARYLEYDEIRFVRVRENSITIFEQPPKNPRKEGRQPGRRVTVRNLTAEQVQEIVRMFRRLGVKLTVVK